MLQVFYSSKGIKIHFNFAPDIPYMFLTFAIDGNKNYVYQKGSHVNVAALSARQNASILTYRLFRTESTQLLIEFDQPCLSQEIVRNNL